MQKKFWLKIYISSIIFVSVLFLGANILAQTETPRCGKVSNLFINAIAVDCVSGYHIEGNACVSNSGDAKLWVGNKFNGYYLPDIDRDGVIDSIDNCTNAANPDQADIDNDGYGDVCDVCAVIYNPDQADADADGDGDVCDNCVAVANPTQADTDNDGLGNACEDTDGDGIYDPVDNCLAIANADQADADNDGNGDVCDNCPSIANSDQANSDADSLGNSCDNCDLVANENQADSDNDGYGDACEDSDGDGDLDINDNCPAVYNPNQEDSDGDGIGDFCDACYNYPTSTSLCVELIATQGANSYTFKPYAVAKTPQQFYNYDPAANSAEITDYPIVTSDRSEIFAYISTSENKLSLGFVHDSTSSTTSGKAYLDFSGADWTSMAIIKVTDDEDSLDRGDEFDKTKNPVGRWEWEENHTDGGMVEMGSLGIPWTITITPTLWDHMENGWFIKIPGTLSAGQEVWDKYASVIITYTPNP